MEKVTAKKLAGFADVPGNRFAIKHFGTRLSEAHGIANTYGINVLDLFYWEQKMGNWQAMSQAEWDIAQEVFCPFNCRSLLTTLLSVDEKYRRPPEYQLYEKLIRYLWPETLSLPINPSKGFRSTIKGLLVRANLFQSLRLRFNHMKFQLLEIGKVYRAKSGISI